MTVSGVFSSWLASDTNWRCCFQASSTGCTAQRAKQIAITRKMRKLAMAIRMQFRRRLRIVESSLEISVKTRIVLPVERSAPSIPLPRLPSAASSSAWPDTSPDWLAASSGWSDASPDWLTASPGWSDASPDWPTASPSWSDASPDWLAASLFETNAVLFTEASPELPKPASSAGAEVSGPEALASRLSRMKWWVSSTGEIM